MSLFYDKLIFLCHLNSLASSHLTAVSCYSKVSFHVTGVKRLYRVIGQVARGVSETVGSRFCGKFPFCKWFSSVGLKMWLGLDLL